jgi:hypothetical protein
MTPVAIYLTLVIPPIFSGVALVIVKAWRE